MNDFESIVHVVDDEPRFLTATSRLLRAHGFEVKAFASAEVFLAQLSDGNHGCVVADLHMPGLSGIELQEAISRTDHAMPVIFLTAHGDIPTSVRAMKSGAEDFLEKRGPTEKLLAAVRRAMTRADDEREAKARLRYLGALFGGLSPREREVLGQVIQGKLNKQIAADLSISERTVKSHRKSITEKVGVPSVAELTRLTHESGLFSPNAATCTKGQ